ncbi:hypothetical protein D5018_13150 [Parashewanella curva]|uniref:Uncharacterized protein n=1 Tax=Parashewanella curva TaxID=2338552 RepID=A0A3L8PX73_9GAMM|nr:hypothetical protein [Parashewanella curva]RLV59223.1 hypothetical protein D5018_13150 [Parashewanella curva]
MTIASKVETALVHNMQPQPKIPEDEGYWTEDDPTYVIECKPQKSQIIESWHQQQNSEVSQASKSKNKFTLLQPTNKSTFCPLGNDYPKTAQQWLQKAHMPVSSENPELTLLLDLDSSSFVAFEFHYQLRAFLTTNTRFKDEDCISCFYKGDTIALFIAVDAQALKAVAQFQQRGHKVAIVTKGRYVFEDTAKLFASYGVELSRDTYFNRTDMHGLKKPKFIDEKLLAGNNCLLIDDKEKNRPINAFFSQIDFTHFPLKVIP